MTRELESMPAAPRRTHLCAAAMAYSLFVVYGSLVPLNFEPLSWRETIGRFQQIPTYVIGVEGRADLVANFLLFIPVSFLWFAACCVDRRRLRCVGAAVIVLPMCAVLAGALEFFQLWFPPRTTSWNDIYAELTGAMVGSAVWFLAGPSTINWMRSYSAEKSARRQLTWLLQSYVLGLVVYSFLPLDLTISPAELVHKYRLGRIQPIPFVFESSSAIKILLETVQDIAIFIPVGMLVANIGLPRPRKRSILFTAFVTTLFAFGLEMNQVFVFSRYANSTDIILATVGGAFGGWLTRHRFFEESKNSASALRSRGYVGWPYIALYVTLLAAGFWYPFDAIVDPHLIRDRFVHIVRTPFSSLYWGSEFNALNLVLAWTLLYAILGALISLRFARRSPAWCVLLIASTTCFIVPLAIELGQLFIVSKVADITQVFVGTLGGILGSLVVSRWQKELSDATWEPADGKAAAASGPFNPSVSVFIHWRRVGMTYGSAGLAIIVTAAGLAFISNRPNAKQSSPPPATISGPIAASNHGDHRGLAVPRPPIDGATSAVDEKIGTPNLIHPDTTLNSSAPPSPVTQVDGSSRKLNRGIETLTGDDWCAARESEREAVARSIADWMHPRASDKDRRTWARRYQAQLDDLARNPATRSGRILDWIPALFGILKQEYDSRSQGTEQNGSANEPRT